MITFVQTYNLKIMKKILLILLCLPLISLGQTNFDLNQLKKIDSKKDFVRYCIENGYEKNCDDIEKLSYARGMESISERNTDCNKVLGTDFATYYNDYGEWVENNTIMLRIKEIDLEWLKKNNIPSYYENIVSEIKKECTFYDIRDVSSNTISVYNCNGDLIGFLVKDINGIIYKYRE